MNPADLKAVFDAAIPLITGLASIGLPGLVVMVLAAPALVVVAVLIMSHVATARMERAQERWQESMNALLEAYRRDTQQIQREMAEKHAEVVSYYHKNVELVKNYERSSEVTQTLIVNNTRVMERLVVVVEARKD